MMVYGKFLFNQFCVCGQNKTVNIEKKTDNVNLRNLKEILVSWRSRKITYFWKMPAEKILF